MNFLTNKQKTPLEFTLMFILMLPIAYLIYFTFVRDYGSFLMMLSSNIVASMFDMHVVNAGSYLKDATLVSNIGLQNSISHEIAYATLPLTEAVVDKVMGVITNTSMVLALSLLLVRSFKVLAIVMSIMLLVHLFSVSAIMTYFMFEVSPQSPILTHYLQALGVTQLLIDISYTFGGISYYYLKFFTPFALAFYVWESHGYGFTQKSAELFSFKSMKLSFMMNESEGVK